MGDGPWRVMMNWRWAVKDHMAGNGKKNPRKRMTGSKDGGK